MMIEALFCWRTTSRYILEPSYEVRERDLESVRQPPQDIQAGIPLAPLDAADVRPMKISLLRELFLGELRPLPESPHALSQRSPQISHGREWSAQSLALNIADRLYSMSRCF